MQNGTTRPLYRLVTEESRQIILTATDVLGFFVDGEETESGTITITGAVFGSPSTPGVVEDAELEVLDVHGLTIGSYYIGRADLGLTPANGAARRDPDLRTSFYGRSEPFPHAGEVWRRWARGTPTVAGEWTTYPPEERPSWLHVVQNAWFTSGRLAARYSSAETFEIDGGYTTDRDSLYCALGESINGPAGYIGSNLDALSDCLSHWPDGSSRSFQLVWNNFAKPGRSSDREYFDAVVDLLTDHDVEVVLR